MEKGREQGTLGGVQGQKQIPATIHEGIAMRAHPDRLKGRICLQRGGCAAEGERCAHGV